MVRDVILLTATVRDGVIPAFSAPDAGNNASFANSAGGVIVVYVNGKGGASSTSTDITVQQVADPYGRINNAAAFTVSTNVIGILGPFPPLLYNQPDNTVHIDYDTVDANAVVFALRVTGT